MTWQIGRLVNIYIQAYDHTFSNALSTKECEVLLSHRNSVSSWPFTE